MGEYIIEFFHPWNLEGNREWTPWMEIYNLLKD